MKELRNKWIGVIAALLLFLGLREASFDSSRLDQTNIGEDSTPERTRDVRGYVNGGIYVNKFFQFSFPIPIGWTVIEDAHIHTQIVSGLKDLTPFQGLAEVQSRQYQDRIIPLFALQPSLSIGEMDSTLIAAITEPVNNDTTPDRYIEAMRNLIRGSSSVSEIGLIGKLPCQGRTLVGFDIKLHHNGQSFFAALYCCVERTYAISFVIRASGDRQFEILKANLTQMEFRQMNSRPIR